MANQRKTLDVEIKEGKYVLAVSGGVDSVVLLDLLSEHSGLDLIAAHFDHGIRPDSQKDIGFVQDLAEKYSLQFEYGEGDLGPDASEETARKARYGFLESIKEKHSADAIITAHHEDDVIETAIINLIRGTNRKGLSSLKSTDGVVRPLLGISKQQIQEYARANSLKWKEDPTNQDTRYLRNYVRLSVIPALNRNDSKWRRRLLNKIKKSGRINLEVNSAIDHLADENLRFEKTKVVIPKNWLIMLPNAVGMEVIKHVVERLEGTVEINQRKLKACLLFAKTGQPGKKRPLDKNVEMLINSQEIHIVSKR